VQLGIDAASQRRAEVVPAPDLLPMMREANSGAPYGTRPLLMQFARSVFRQQHARRGACTPSLLGPPLWRGSLSLATLPAWMRVAARGVLG
jgi:hypothetical protein